MGFFEGKRVLVTGNTGFKGTWMCCVLRELGANVNGYSLSAPTVPSLFELSKIENDIRQTIGDIRQIELLQKVFDEIQPEIVIHMAAQPIVRESYRNPVYTYDVNVMGTVNVLECVRKSSSVRSFVNVTTDKVYKNREWEWGYRENEELNGSDPYSNSKSCSELVTGSYDQCFLKERGTAVSTVRAGNVIGGGDFSADRIIPDCLRAIENRQEIVLRNAFSVRPYQHVLEALFAYLMIAERQYEDINYAGSYNVGPEESSCVTTAELVQAFCTEWEKLTGCKMKWRVKGDGGPHEDQYLRLDSSKLRNIFGWKPLWSYKEAVNKTAEWMREYISGGDVSGVMRRQIGEYYALRDEAK